MINTLPDNAIHLFLSNEQEASGGLIHWMFYLFLAWDCSHACPFNWHSRGCCIRGFTGCIPLGAAASHYSINDALSNKYQRGNVFIQIKDDPPEIKHLLRRNDLLFHTLNIQSMSDSTCLYQSVSLSPLHSQCLLANPHAWLRCHSTTYHRQSHPLHWIYNTS
jgi:hypothetical protein